MTTLLRSQGLTFEGGVLSKPCGVSDCWNCSALFAVADSSRFSFTVDVLDGAPGRRIEYIVGIAPSGCKLSSSAIENTCGAFLNLSANRVAGLDAHPKAGKKVHANGWHVPLSRNLLKQKGQVELSLMEGSLYLAFEGQPRFEVVSDIPPGEYHPCISIANPGQRLRVLVRTPAVKRRFESSDGEALQMSASLWENREFTDAIVVCGQKEIRVHRCILAAASPFFAAAFRGNMQEGRLARINIGEASEATVESFLRYLYTKALPEGTDCMDLLPLAHRYECRPLLLLVVSDILGTLKESNVAKYVAMLRPFENDEVVGECWEAIAARVGADKLLAKALMRGEFEPSAACTA